MGPSGRSCRQPGCTGAIEEGYCSECGLAPQLNATALLPPANGRGGRSCPPGPRSGSSIGRSLLGAGLVVIPRVEPREDPSTAVLTDQRVPEDQRFCAGCRAPVGRSRDGVPGRADGVCACGHPFSFTARLGGGEVVAGQYEVVGCLAHGGMGWVYLARDRRVSDRWVVLKGLIDKESEAARSAARAERDFLAKVDHPDIVKIHNFVAHDDEDYIVMEYVNGTSLRDLLASWRRAYVRSDPRLRVTHAISFVLGILPAIGHLHAVGLLYCDLKPSNIMQSGGSLKLIDLGGVRRIDDHQSHPVGTHGYMAPEADTTGPTVASDLYTAGRTLAVLCSDEPGGTRGSLQRLLDRATAVDPADRFESAEDMEAQLRGVLHELVPVGPGGHRPFPSTRFEPGGVGVSADWRALPRPLPDTDDPTYAFLLSLGDLEAYDRVIRLDDAPYNTREVVMSRVRTLIELDRLDDARALLDAIAVADRTDWRADWYHGLTALADGDDHRAAAWMDGVHRRLPGELAPKLGLAFAAELSGDHSSAIEWYDVVSRTDPSFTSAWFGLARCRRALGDTTGAAAAYDRVPPTSSDHAAAQRALAEHLLASGRLDDVHAAERVVRQMPAGRQRTQLAARVLEAAFRSLPSDGAAVGAHATILDCPMTDRGLRLGLEQTYRELARSAGTAAERISLVDRANGIRPRSFW